MPNWCNNTLTLTHEDPNMIQRAITAFSEGRLCGEFHPIDPQLLEDERWYDWCVTNWGTKWDVGGEDGISVQEGIDGTSVQFIFDSAWSPPIELYKHLEENHGFVVNASYYEPAMGFAGEVLDSELFDYVWTDLKEAKEVIPEHIDELYGITADIEQWEEEDE